MPQSEIRRLQYYFFPHMKTEMKYAIPISTTPTKYTMPKSVPQKRANSTPKQVTLNKVENQIPGKYMPNAKSEKKRSDESEGFGVDINDIEPFERSVREQEGRRYLLWRKVTG